MEIAKLLVVFVTIMMLIRFNRPLSMAIFLGAVLTGILYKISILNMLELAAITIKSWDTISVILAFYLITFLQRMLEKRGHLDLAQKSLSRIFNNRRINTALAPFFIGLLPSPGAIFISGEMVDKTTEDYFSKEDKTFVTTFYRHIPESFLPTYPGIILASQISGVSLSSFVIFMIPPVGFLFLLGYLFYLRKIPVETGLEESDNKIDDVKNLIKSLWTIGLAILLILIFDLPVYICIIISIILSIFINKFTIEELKPMFKSAFEGKILLNSVVVMYFKEVINHTGAITILPQMLSGLPLPKELAFAIIFFVGTIVSGSMAIIAMCLPLAVAAIPDGGVSLLMLLMSFSYAAMQFSPTHICLTLATEYFDTSMVELLKRTAPVIASFCILVYIYFIFINNIIFV